MTQTDATPPTTLAPNEALYWAVADAFLQRRLGEPTAEDLDALLTEHLATFVPEADEAQRDFHKVNAIRYIMGAVASSGMGHDLPGEVLLWNIDKDKPEAMRPLRAVTGVLTTVLVASTKEELAAVEQFALPLAEQAELETLLKQHFGTSKDVVSVTRFPFQATDYFRLGIDEILTRNLVAGAQGDDDVDYEQPFRQALLRRQPLSRVWKMPDGKYGYVALWPVTIISMLAADYWQHGTEFGEAPSQAVSRILASALAQRELLGTRVDIYCGHLHVGAEVVNAVTSIETDLAESGAKLQKMPARRTTARVGRNLPCPCGSGLKFKKCCGAG
jgi:hypothetical protein